jgi:hypothetical protein
MLRMSTGCTLSDVNLSLAIACAPQNQLPYSVTNVLGYNIQVHTSVLL